MKRFAAPLALAATLLGWTLAGTALGQNSNVPNDADSPQAQTFHSPQNQGDAWSQDPYGQDGQDQNRQDRYRGDGSWNGGNQSGSGWGQSGSGWGFGHGRFNRANLEGRWVADDRSADYRSNRGDLGGRGGMRRILLPEFIRVDQRPSMVRIADSRNRLVQQIMIGGKFDSRGGDRFDNRPDYLVGRWRGSTLIVERMGPRGDALTQTFALENRGRSLVVHTRREGWGPRGTMEFTTTYHRA